MSTTLTVLRVLMSADHDTLGHDRLMSQAAASALMTSSSTSSMVASLDPVLVDFWSGFPCPPPWNEGLLFRVNWTACVSETVGERIRWFLADRCNIAHNHSGILPGTDSGGGGGFGGYGEQEGGEACDMSCKILVGLFCTIFVIGVILGGVIVLHRRRSKRKDQRGTQQAAATAGDRGRTQYAGIHYASASVINREAERPLPPCPEGQDSGLPRQLHSYVYNPRDDHPSPDNGLHLHLCPMNRRAAYRAMEHNSSSRDSEDAPHVYDYISDTESVRWRGSTRGGNEYTYCTCDFSDCGSSVAAEHNTSTPRQSEGYHSDHDHSRQHEVSKPYPRYPDKTVVAAGTKPMPGGVVGGLNNNNNDGNPVLGFRESVPVGDSARGPADFLSGVRNHPGFHADSRNHPGALIGQAGIPVENRGRGGLPLESRVHAGIPVDNRIRGDLPFNNRVHNGRPADHVGGGGGFHGDTWRHSGGELRFENALPDGRLSTIEGQSDAYEYPEHPDEAAQRANALALHPQYFADYFGGGTSSV